MLESSLTNLHIFTIQFRVFAVLFVLNNHPFTELPIETVICVQLHRIMVTGFLIGLQLFR